MFKRLIPGLISVLAVCGFAANASAQISEEVAEAYITAKVCHDVFADQVLKETDGAEMKMYWTDQYRSFDSNPNKAALDAGYLKVKPEFDALDPVEFYAFCSNEYVVRELAEKTKDIPVTEEAAKFEAELLGYQTRLQPIMEASRVTGLFGSYYIAAITKYAQSDPSEEEIMAFTITFFRRLTQAMEAHAAAKVEFEKRPKDVAMLVSIDEFILTSCDAATRANVHKQLKDKNFEQAFNGFIDFSLYQSMINFRSDLGGGKSEKSANIDTSKFILTDNLETKDVMLGLVYKQGCNNFKSLKPLETIWSSLYYGPRKAAGS